MQTKSSKTFSIVLASIIGLGAFSASAAHADTLAGFKIGITINSGIRDHRAPMPQIRDHRAPGNVVVRDHRTPRNGNVVVRDHRTPRNSNVVVRDHRTPPRQNTVVVVPPQSRFSCTSGIQKLKRMGYRNVGIYDCSAPVYHYTAMDGHALYRARMNARSGQMTVAFIGIANRN